MNQTQEQVLHELKAHTKIQEKTARNTGQTAENTETMKENIEEIRLNTDETNDRSTRENASEEQPSVF